MPSLIRLRMLDNGYRVDVEAVQGTLAWSLPGCVPPATATPTPSGTPTPTPPADADADATPTGPPCPPAQPQGAHWQLHLDDATHTTFVLDDLGVPAAPPDLVGRFGRDTAATSSSPARSPTSRRGAARRSTSSGGCAGT